MENLALFAAAGAALAIGALVALGGGKAPALATAPDATAGPAPAADAADADAPPPPTTTTTMTTAGALPAPRRGRTPTSRALEAALAAAPDAAPDASDALDLDEWRGRRAAARFSCDVCVVGALLLAIAWVLTSDYGVDLPEAVARALPREAALLRDLAGGAREALAAPGAWWREWRRGEEL